jgi:hypothetical protein
VCLFQAFPVALGIVNIARIISRWRVMCNVIRMLSQLEGLKVLIL